MADVSQNVGRKNKKLAAKSLTFAKVYDIINPGEDLFDCNIAAAGRLFYAASMILPSNNVRVLFFQYDFLEPVRI